MPTAPTRENHLAVSDTGTLKEPFTTVLRLRGFRVGAGEMADFPDAEAWFGGGLRDWSVGGWGGGGGGGAEGVLEGGVVEDCGCVWGRGGGSVLEDGVVGDGVGAWGRGGGSVFEDRVVEDCISAWGGSGRSGLKHWVVEDGAACFG